SLAAYRWTPPTSDYGSPGLPNDCAALTIGKSVVPQTAVQLGNAITYTIRVTNTGGDAAGVRVVDILPVGVSGAHLDWTGLIAAHATAVFTLPGVVTTSAAFYGQTLLNTAVYTYLTHSDVATATVALATAPDLSSSTKTVYPTGAVQRGDDLTYTVTLRNTGGHPATVTLTDTLPAGLLLVSGFDGGGLTWNGVIAAGESRALTLVAQADPALPETIVVSNTVVIDDGYHLPFARSAPETAILVPQLQLTKSVVPTSGIFPGDEVTYTLTLQNLGEGLAVGVVLTDTLPWEMNFVAWLTQDGAAISDDTITWRGNLAGGASVVISFRAAVRSDSFFLAHPVVNTAMYTAVGLPDGSASATFVLGGVPAPTLGKFVETPDPLYPGDSVTYTLTLDNAAGIVGGLILTDVLPSEVDFTSWIVQNGASVNDDVITWSGDLVADAHLVISFRATLHAEPALYGATITNTASFVAANTLPGVADAAFTVAQPPQTPLLRFAKTVQTDGVPLPGDGVTYTLTLLNLGGSDATGVLLTDTLPVALDFGGWIAQNGASVADDVITWGGTLPGSASLNVVFMATLHTDPASQGQTITNTAQATADNADGVTAEVAFTVGSSGAGVVTITKEVTAATAVDMGDVVTYTITLDNSGDAPAAGVLLTDTLPVEVDFGGWVAQNDATVTADVLTWSGDLADGANITFVFTATVRSDVVLDGRAVANTARFTWGATAAEDAASFTLKHRWWIFLPLTMRNF
ncbi:MAG TPA: hypothetical protein PKZ84_10895, partial [Anaerolineae bacterium]|nr:hypothetical protein [Anaerolineae bacterium]HQI86189.1 hypothetical protein [Anaerolineae bacterium]